MPSGVDQGKVQAELEFWRGLVGSVSLEEFAQIRLADFEDYANNLPEIRTLEGAILDLCCGPWSIFEGQGKGVIAADRLYSQYLSIVHPHCDGVEYRNLDGEDLSGFRDGEFDFCVCFNCIDHTPNPELMLAEIRRVLRPGGRLLFEVHFDPACYAPHYRLWNRETVDEHMGNFRVVRVHEEYWAAHGKTRFWGVYER